MWGIILYNKFGRSNGIFYNHPKEGYFLQRAKINADHFKRMIALKSYWGNRGIDVVQSQIDKNLSLPIFTPDHKFISPDCIHFTPAGAKFYAEKLKVRTILYAAPQNSDSNLR